MRAGLMSTRRAVVVAVTVALLCGASGMRAQGQAPAAAAPDQWTITSEQGLVIFQVEPTKTAEWESAWAEIKTKLSALTAKPDHKALGESINMLKVAAPAAADQPAIYVLYLNPPAKVSYDPTKFLFVEGVMPRPEADAIFEKIKVSFKGVNVLPLTKVVK
jgi:hypothetical protein